MVIKKIFSIIACAVFTSALLCGCGKKEESSVEYYYGQAIKEVNGKAIYLSYDGRFISDEEMDAVVNYYDSIQRKDYDLFAITQDEEYLNFLDEKQGFDVESYVGEEYAVLEEDLGANFDFAEMEVVDCGDSQSDSGINDIKELLDGIYAESGKDKSFSDTVKEAKYIVFDLSATGGDGETYSLKDEMKYIFTCDDGIYIF